MEGNVWGDARKAASLREAPPSRSLPKRFVGARFWGGGRFSGRSSATSIGAANGRLFRLRKTAMLSRHWRLWLSFPSLALPPEERLGIGLSFLSNLRAHESWARSFVFGMRSRRLTEPPRPAYAGERTPLPAYGGRLPFQGRLCGKRRPKGSLRRGSSQPKAD